MRNEELLLFLKDYINVFDEEKSLEIYSNIDWKSVNSEIGKNVREWSYLTNAIKFSESMKMALKDRNKDVLINHPLLREEIKVIDLKISEMSAIKELVQLYYSHKDPNTFSKDRDRLLTNVIMSRVYMSFQKFGLRESMSEKDISLNSSIYKASGLNMEENHRDIKYLESHSRLSLHNKLNKACSVAKRLLDSNALLPEDEIVKQLMFIGLLAPQCLQANLYDAFGNQNNEIIKK